MVWESLHSIGSRGGENGRGTARTCDMIGAMSRARVRIELGTPEDCAKHWREYLSKGGAYATGETPEDVEVIVVLVRTGCPDLELDGKTVYRMGGGTGYELLGWNDRKDEIEAWCHMAPE